MYACYTFKKIQFKLECHSSTFKKLNISSAVNTYVFLGKDYSHMALHSNLICNSSHCLQQIQYIRITRILNSGCTTLFQHLRHNYYYNYVYDVNLCPFLHKCQDFGFVLLFLHLLKVMMGVTNGVQALYIIDYSLHA